MKVITNVDELKIGDKIDAVIRPKAYNDYGIAYLLVEYVSYTGNMIKVSYINYKGKIILTTTFIIPHPFTQFKFYEP